MQTSQLLSIQMEICTIEQKSELIACPEKQMEMSDEPETDGIFTDGAHLAHVVQLFTDYAEHNLVGKVYNYAERYRQRDVELNIYNSRDT